MQFPEYELSDEAYERMPANEVGFIFIGPSGAGKSTLRNYLCKHGDGVHQYAKYLPLTTRQKRPGEGEEYRFVTPTEMASAKISKNVIFGNNSYGNDFLTLWPERLPEGYHYIYIYLPAAAVKLKETFPNTKIIQIRPASINQLEERILLRDRNIAVDELQRRTAAVKHALDRGKEIAEAILINDGSIQEVGTRLQETLKALSS